MSPERRTEALRLLEPAIEPKWTRYIPHRPTPTQRAFLLLDNVREVFFGGAAGGGKSDALLMAALQYVDVPRYNAIMFRKTYPDLALPGALLDRAREWLMGSDAKWDDREHTWRFPNPEYDATIYRDGATITFGYLQTDRQKYRYQSAEFQAIFFDELTQFERSSYTYLFSRLRRTSEMTVPLRMRSASNPGNIGHAWVQDRFISNRDPSRLFIPSRLADNPYLRFDEYAASLSQLDPITRQRLLEGDWSIHDEGMFKRAWFPLVDHVPERLRKVRYWDLASTEDTGDNDPDWTVGVLMGRDPTTLLLYLLDVRRMRGSPHKVEALVRSTAMEDGVEVPIFIEEEGGASGKGLIDYYLRHVLAGYALRGVRQHRDKVTRAAPLASQAEAGIISIRRAAWNADLLDELEAFPMVVHDDQVDATSGAFEALVGAPVTTSKQYRPPDGQQPVYVRGDLRLVGKKYIDKP